MGQKTFLDVADEITGYVLSRRPFDSIHTTRHGTEKGTDPLSLEEIIIFSLSQLPLRPKPINCRFEVVPGDGLRQEVIEARSVALLAVPFVGIPCYCNQHLVLELFVFTKVSCEVNTVHFGHSKVQKNHVRDVGFCGFEGCGPVISNVGLVTVCNE